MRTYDQPVQSFVWDDFTAKPGQRFTYRFHPLKGRPKNLDRSSEPIPITVETEPLTAGAHDVYFNRGVASSQAYTREFKNQQPDKIVDAAERARAYQWLSRRLDEKLFEFIDAAGRGDTLLGAFYEFRYRPAADRLKAALDRGVNVKLVLDGKDNGYTDRQGNEHKAFPLTDNENMVRNSGLPSAAIIWRKKNPDAIAHNKFLVLLKGAAETPEAVWTGSTNLSDGGIHGQTNVGHWVRDANVASAFHNYWAVLEQDLGKTATATRAQNTAAIKANRDAVEALGVVPADWKAIPRGTTPVFSPRSGGSVLDMYAAMLDESADAGCVTLAFGISDVFKSRLVDNPAAGPLLFLLLEKRDQPRPNSNKPFKPLGARQNIYAAWGSYLKDPLYQWTRETNAGRLQLNTHVSYIHSKFLLKDPLSNDPIVVTGSANFSQPSTNDNDENMLLIRGDQRAADIYFTEFNRLFFHYYFRSVQEATHCRLRPDRFNRRGRRRLVSRSDRRLAAKIRPRNLPLKTRGNVRSNAARRHALRGKGWAMAPSRRFWLFA